MKQRSKLLVVFKLVGQTRHSLAIVKRTEGTDVVMVLVHGRLMVGVDTDGMLMPLNGVANGPKAML